MADYSKHFPIIKSLIAGLLVLALAFTMLAAAGAPPISEAGAAAAFCPPLALPIGHTVNVNSVAQLETAVNQAAAGDIILIADGVYALDGVYLRIDTPQVMLRSASGQRDTVILDGNYLTTEIIQIVATGVTIADLTLREAYDHPIHVMSAEGSDTLNTLIYNVHIIDPGQQAIKINPAAAGYYPDNGIIACSTIELTAAGRSQVRDDCYTGGVDGHQARGWSVRDTLIRGFWCDTGLSEHAIHFWSGSRDTLIERNWLLDNARGIGFGLVESGSGRAYPDDPCPQASGYVDHFAGTARNNMVAANETGLFASQYGFDCGICFWNACEVQAQHNTVYTADPEHTFSAIEWRFPNTQAEIVNNLVNHTLHPRDGAAGELSGNLSEAQAGWFVNASEGDLHLLAAGAAAIDTAAASAVSDDFDGQTRPSGSAADVGADERLQLPPGDEWVYLPLVRR